MKWISNKTLFNIHGWLGLNIGLFLFVVCFSGTFATLSSEVDWLLNEDLRIEQKDKPIQWEKMYQNLQKEFPDGTLIGLYKNTYAGRGSYFATVAYISLPNNQSRKIYLNPYTGNIQGSTSFFNVQRFFRSYHRRFFDGDRGIFLVTLSSIFLLFSVLTGFLFYKGWLKNLFKLRISKGIKKLWSDAHKLTGVWSLIFALLIALTGVFYFVEMMIGMADNADILRSEPPAPITLSERVDYGPNPQLLSLDEYVANAKEVYPALEVKTIRVPHQPSGYVYIDGEAGSLITRNRANKVYLHPFSGEVVQVLRDSELNAAEFITDIADPLHFGYFAGLPTKILWFILGLGISFAILSGTYLWYIRGIAKMERKLKRKRKSVQKSENTDGDRSKGILAKAGFLVRQLTMSRGAVLSTILTILYLVSTGVSIVDNGIQSYGPMPVERFEALDTVHLGPWVMDLKCEYPCKLSSGTLVGSFEGDGIPNYESLSLKVMTTENDTLTGRFTGSAKGPSLAMEWELAKGAVRDMHIKAETLDGKVFTAGISPQRFRQAQIKLNNRFQTYPQKAYPDIPLGVYLYISFFGLCTLTVLGFWTYFLFRATTQQVKLAE